MKLTKLIRLAGMAIVGGFLLAGQAQAVIFVIDDFNTGPPTQVVNDLTADGVAGIQGTGNQVATNITGNNVVWEFADGINPPLGPGLTVNPMGPNNATRDIYAELDFVDQISTEICNNCKAGHLVSGAGGSSGNSSFIYSGPSVDINGTLGVGPDNELFVMFAYAADQDGAVVQFTFDRTGFADVVVSSAPLANTANSNITANGVEVSLPLPLNAVFDDLESVRIDILGVADLDLTIDNAKLFAVPEPATLAMLGLGLLGLGWQRRRRTG